MSLKPNGPITTAAAACLATVLGLPTPAVARASEGPTAAAVAQLETDAAKEPLGIDTKAPRFTWRTLSARRGVLQAAYRVLVASRAELAAEGRADVWDSGRVESADPWCLYGGPTLRSRTRYFWNVRVFTGADAEAAPAAVTWFETAFVDPAEWAGEWIAGEERSGELTPEEGVADDARIRAAGELCRPVAWLTTGRAASIPNNQGECREIRPAPLFRKAFAVRKPVARARLYSSGLAYADLRLNGAPVSDSVLDPGFTDYGKTVLYTTHDVSGLLRGGENVVGVELGSGHFDDATRTWDWGWTEAEWRATPRLRLLLSIEYEDGEVEEIRSDRSWKVSVDGPHRFDSFYLGETWDARREIPGWDRPGFDDAGWAPARVVDAPAGVLRAQAHEPIRVVDTRPPGKRSEPAPGVVVYDVGQNLTGWAELHVRAPRGTAVELFYSEKVDADGRASTNGNGLVLGQLQTDDYVAKGDGEEVWSPRFTYKGFRYVQLSGPGGAPLPQGVVATIERVQHVRTGLARASTFESSQPTLDRIHRNTAWAIQSNMHGIVTDTPVYEKNGWTGDAQLTAGAASILFDTERLYRKMFQDMRDAQTPQGELSLLSPANEHFGYLGQTFKAEDCCGATPAWDAFWFVLPWESYMRHGDRRALETVYPAMRRYLDDWVPRWTDKDGDDYAHTLTSGLGDWVSPRGVPTINALATTAYYAHLVDIARRAARALGRDDDASRYDRLFEAIRSDFGARFRFPDGSYGEKWEEGFLQTAQILPLHFGLVPEDEVAALAQRLADDIVRHRDGNPWVGVLGASYVLPVLTATGHHDAAVTVATQTDEPSWGYWTDVLGFTALGESWPADTRSRNHHFFGAIAQWMYEDLGGFRPLEPGYRLIEFRPEIPASGLDRVSASYESVRGTVATAWHLGPTGLELDVTVPPNATGRVYVPASRPEGVREVGSGREVAAADAPSVSLVGVEGDRVVYEIGSGHYLFLVAGGAR